MADGAGPRAVPGQVGRHAADATPRTPLLLPAVTPRASRAAATPFPLRSGSSGRRRARERHAPGTRRGESHMMALATRLAVLAVTGRDALDARANAKCVIAIVRPSLPCTALHPSCHHVLFTSHFYFFCFCRALGNALRAD